MAYEKQTWHTGDIITEGKLNHMEDGIANALSGVVIVNITEVDETLVADKTFAEIVELYSAGSTVLANYYGLLYQLYSVTPEGGVPEGAPIQANFDEMLVECGIVEGGVYGLILGHIVITNDNQVTHDETVFSIQGMQPIE